MPDRRWGEGESAALLAHNAAPMRTVDMSGRSSTDTEELVQTRMSHSSF